MKHVQRRWWIAKQSWWSRSTLTCGRSMAIMAAVGAVVLAAASAQAAIGESNARKPFVMIMMDSSSSMEWTDEGDEEYPYNGGDAGEWESGSSLSDVERYGPCFVWKVDNCSDYDRPAWNTDETWSDNSSGSKISARRGAMEDTANKARLKNSSQPRHVTLKEILTGDMLMYGTDTNKPLQDLNPTTHGPGCWLVPRQYGSSSGSPDICTDNPGDLEQIKKYPDYDDALPHFQEVFDGQLRNGLMDTISGNAIFGVAMFDGYKQSIDEPVKGWQAGDAKHLDDSMKQDKEFGGLIEGKGDASKSKQKQANYNLGVFQMLAPEKMEMSTTVASEISSFVQYALIDAGYLSQNDRKLHTRGDQNSGLATNQANNELGVEFSGDLSDYFGNDYNLGRQPIARATPLAAAMYDIHEFFALGRRGKKYGKKKGKKHSNKSPVIQDTYKQCRPKHVILITDGEPEPEREPEDDDQVVNLGLNTLSSAFQYDRAQYPYPPTERAIEYFMNDWTYQPLNADGSLGSAGDERESPGSDASYLAGDWSGSGDSYDDAVRYNPRVHVVGLTGQVDQNPGGPDNLEKKVVHKLANMAKEGRTCAGYYLGKEWIPKDDNDSDPSGTCNRSETYCLDQRQATFIDGLDDDPDDNVDPYMYIDHEGEETACRYPALVLSTTNEDADLVKRTAQAMQLLFNNIVGTGLTARTRPTYVNHIDDPNHQIGGQYRFYSGLSTDVGETFRRGLLYRQAKICSNDADTGKSSLNAPGSAPDSVDIAEQIAKLAPESGGDRRRIFTSFASDDAFNYQTRTPKRLASGEGISDRLRFLFGMDLQEADNDEFGSTTMGIDLKRLTDTRVRFEKEELQNVLTGLNDSNADLSEDLTPHGYFNLSEITTVEDFVDEIRGRSDRKKFDPDTGTGRAFGGIRNATPVAVEPPNLDLPIDSYRAFKGQYADRPSMLFSATTDGLLHAIYSGQLDGSTDQLVPKRGDDGQDGSDTTMDQQREAWAYIPQMLHKKLGANYGQPPYLLDGTPTVKDVRLCHQTNAYNFNLQACRCNSSSSDGSCMTQVDQWRSVLVEGLGRAGAGYFALDVTRPGGDVTGSDPSMPDPIPLWEFDANWERGQVAKLGQDHPDLVYPKSGDLLDGSDGNFIDECDSEENSDTSGDDVKNFYWDQPFLGLSVGQAAIGTIALQAKFSDGDRLRRPIAVFSGGLNIEDRGCDSDRIGRAIYVVDLQTGSLLRRFVTYHDEDGEQRFENPISGSPALYDARPGSLATRGFVGGGDGKLFRIDMSSDDPEEWQVDLFFDPSEDLDDDSGSGGGPGNASVDFGPAAFKPALALSTADLNHDLLVFYGLGERGDLSTSGSTQMMIAVQEKINTSGDEYEVSAVGDPLWYAPFQDGSGDYKEKLTSEPVVFNKGVYFTSFVEPSEDSCEPGWSRIYGMKFEGGIDSNGEHVPEGLFGDDSVEVDGRTETLIPEDTEGYRYEGEADDPYWAYQPENTNGLSDPVVVRGVSVTLGASCLSNPAQASGVQVQQQERTPTLMAQSSSDKLSDSDDDPVGSAGTDDLHAIEQSLAKPDTQIIPLSWGVVDN